MTSILLCLALGAAIFCAVQTVRAIQRFQFTRSQAAQNDVNTIQPWMSIHYISRAYSVPEWYLTEHLNITDSRSVTHVPLRTLAGRYNRSVESIIRDLQTAIQAYRKQNSNRHFFSNLPVSTLLALERSVT